MYWYRLEQSLGRFNLVGTTVKTPEVMPQELLADEKHTWRNGKKHYIAMTVAEDCILGSEMIDSACEDSLTQAYGVFAHEARSVKPDYKPNTVNGTGLRVWYWVWTILKKSNILKYQYVTQE